MGGVTCNRGTRTNKRSQELHTVEYLPEGQTPRALLFFQHGYGEHIGRYRSVHTELASSGIAVFGMDAHGHGRSEPRDEDDRALVHAFSHLVEDYAEYAGEVRARFGGAAGPPAFAAGQSMGGLLATHLVLRDQTAWAGLILCSAAIDIEWSLVTRIQAPIGNLLALLVPRWRIVPAVPLEYISNDPAVVADFAADPLNFVGNVRAKTANELLKGFREVQQRQAELRVPLLALHGTHDHITSYPAVKRLLQVSQSRDASLVEFPGAYHELFMGAERDASVRALRDCTAASAQPRGWVLQHVHQAEDASKL
ncbi:hypothetical protein WJX81_005243 [Elliptochloris bilobata]|uniref:Serine aminopeptidase S33 domain-containing protein n=1 Tax=Elliptochloris bilobata TaxID=381761 RepID=A0AAW1QXD4_9CHLO